MSIVVLKDIRGSERLQDDLSKPLHFLTSRKKPHWDTRPHVRPCSSAERSQRSRVQCHLESPVAEPVASQAQHCQVSQTLFPTI